MKASFDLNLDHMQHEQPCILQMKEQYNKDVLLSGVTPNALEEVLNYMYTEKITLSEANVADVLQAASLMLLTGKKGWILLMNKLKNTITVLHAITFE